MKFVSTRKNLPATSVETVFQGLAPDGGLYVPESVPKRDLPQFETFADAERFVLATFFDDFPESVREEAIARLLSRFPENDPVPIVKKDGKYFLELFHGKTGAFKDVALSMLSVFMRYSAAGRRVLVLTATSGDTGSAAMQGFAGVEGTEIGVFFPNVGTSRVQRLQMTTPSEANVHAYAIRGNFDDAQSAVKRIFASKEIAAEAAKNNVYLTSANSINTGRLIPQIGYYLYASSKLGECDVVVPTGNFGNLLAAYYAKLMGAKIRKCFCASNENDLFARFLNSGRYRISRSLKITNSPSMDILRASNAERLLWLLNDGDSNEVARLMADFEQKGDMEVNEKAKEALMKNFLAFSVTPEETIEEMRRVKKEADYIVDPHTAVASFAGRMLGFPHDGVPFLVAATATPWKFPETCREAFGVDLQGEKPQSFRDLESLPITQNEVVDVDKIDDAVLKLIRG